MPYRIKQWNDVVGEVQRIAREQIDRALGAIDDPAKSEAGKIHAGRKRCKKLRGLVRLVRPSLKKKQYEAINRHFRDAARRVSAGRDAAVFVGTYDKVCDRFDDQIDRRAMASIRAGLTRRLQETGSAGDGDLTSLERLRADFIAGLKLFEEIELDDNGFDAIEGGLAKTYGRAVDDLAKVQEKPSAKAFHDWRKRVKYHRYHLKLLRGLWEDPIEALGDEASELGDLLGDAHDLVAIDKHLCREPEGLGNTEDLDAFRALAKQLRSELEAEAVIAGQRLLADKPKRLVKRFAKWHAAAEQAELCGAGAS